MSLNVCYRLFALCLHLIGSITSHLLEPSKNIFIVQKYFH